jgi:hypothetical protein
LVAELGSDEVVRVVLPDGEDAADGKVSIDDGAAIEGVICHHVSFALSDRMVDRPLLAGKSLHQWIGTQVFLHDLIALHVLVQLLVSELIHGFQNYHWRVP